MPTIIKKEFISIPKIEYKRLRKLDERFEKFLSYIEHLIDIREARKEVRQRKVVSQEELFEKLGF